MLAKLLVFSLVVQLLIVTGVSATASEVSSDYKGHWAETEIEYLVGKGIINANKTAEVVQVYPNRNITRAEYATLLVRATGAPLLPSPTPKFTDIETHWAKAEIESACLLGIIKGYSDGTFKPNNPLTRAEMASMIVRAFELQDHPDGVTNPQDWTTYSDLPTTNWAYPDILSLTNLGYVKGYDGNLLKPTKLTTRAESMAILSRVLKDQAPKDVNVVLSTNEINSGDEVVISLEQQALQGFTFELSGDGVFTTKDNVVSWKPPVAEGTYNLIIKFKYVTDSGKTHLYERAVTIKVKAQAPSTDGTSGGSSSGSTGGSSGGTTPTPTPTDFVIEWDGSEFGTIASVGFSLPFAVKTPETIALPASYEWDVTGGTISPSTDGSASWLLTQEGVYTISVRVRDADGKVSNTLKQEFTGVDLGESQNLGEIGFLLDIDDSDLDGLTNEEELTLGTDPYLYDTDGDGLDDYTEVNVTFTNPLLADTDGDGISDGEEYALGLNPLLADSNGDGIPDGAEKHTYTDRSQEGVTVSVYGDHTVAHLFVDEVTDSFLANARGIASPVYEFELDGNLDYADLTFSYNDADLQARGLTADELSIYYINEDLDILEPVPSVVDPETGTVTGTVTHFSKYVLADSTKVSEETGSIDFVFVLDNSGSMEWNDPENIRFLAANSLIDDLNGDYRFGAVEFSDYADIRHHLTSEKEPVKMVIADMAENIGGGTAIGTSLHEAIPLFDGSDRQKVIILLTDGDDFDHYSITDAVEKAKSEGIQIYTIGLGEGVDSDLLSNIIATPTGGKYYPAIDAESLLDVFDIFATSVDAEIVELSVGSKTIKGELVYKTGFDPLKHGYSFSNGIRTDIQQGGLCQGFAVTAYFYYNKTYPSTHAGGKYGGKDVPSYNTSNVTALQGYKDLYKHTNYYAKLNGQIRYSWEKVGGKYVINDKYRKVLIDAGFSIHETKSGEDTYEIAHLDTSTKKATTKEAQDSLEVIKSIQLWWAMQESSKRNEVDSIGELMTEMSTNGTAIINFFGSGAGHAVNAFQIYKDTEKKNRYWLAVYDNNYAGQTRYLQIDRKKEFLWAGTKYTVESSDYSWAKGRIYFYEP